MVSGLFSLVMAAALGQQAPAEAAWLKAVPADADVVVHVKGLRSSRDELLSMLNAMSPNLGQIAGPALTQGLDQMAGRLGERSTTTPFLVAMELPRPDAQGTPPLAILVQSDNYEAVLKEIAGPNAQFKPEKQAGGYDKFTDQDGESIYSLKGQGFVAFAPGNEELIRAMAAKPGATLADKIAGPVQEHLFGGDVGAYVSIVALQNQYGEQIEGARQTFMAMLDQAGGQMQGNQIEQAKAVYGAMFDALKVADALALNLDFDAAQFALSGLLTVRPDTEAAAALGRARVGTGEGIGNLPADSLMYLYFNSDPETFAGLQAMNMSNLGNLGANTDEMKKALEDLKAAGSQEAYGAFSFGDGIRVVNVTYPEDVEKQLTASTEMMKAMKSSEMFKDVKIEDDALSYKGFQLRKATVTFDLEKMAAAQPNNPAGEAVLRSMFGGDSMTTWYGSDGKRIVSVVARDAEGAKAQIDTIVDGTRGVGSAGGGLRAVRAKLPEKVSVLFLVNAQELIRQVTSLMSSMSGQKIPPPSGLPKDPALFGGSLAVTPEGYHFDFVVPSAVGPVFENGFGPLIQGLQGQINQ